MTFPLVFPWLAPTVSSEGATVVTPQKRASAAMLVGHAAPHPAGFRHAITTRSPAT